jgi:hypothetical protein
MGEVAGVQELQELQNKKTGTVPRELISEPRTVFREVAGVQWLQNERSCLSVLLPVEFHEISSRHMTSLKTASQKSGVGRESRFLLFCNSCNS